MFWFLSRPSLALNSAHGTPGRDTTFSFFNRRILARSRPGRCKVRDDYPRAPSGPCPAASRSRRLRRTPRTIGVPSDRPRTVHRKVFHVILRRPFVTLFAKAIEVASATNDLPPHPGSSHSGQSHNRARHPNYVMAQRITWVLSPHARSGRSTHADTLGSPNGRHGVRTSKPPTDDDAAGDLVCLSDPSATVITPPLTRLIERCKSLSGNIFSKINR